ncbi:MAG: cob(I)yrinic acid a,c-diamide adenosyltransferase [bacterium]
MAIYTRTGDKGKTSLFSGERIEKNHDRVEAYGNVDELNTHLGVLEASLPPEMASLAADIRQIQTTLFHIGSWMATTAGSTSVAALERIGDDRVAFLEKAIDTMTAQLPELKGFILPGGSQAAAFAHVARTVCRRAERRILKLVDKQDLGITEDQFGQICVFINRLSDYLFTVARFINHQLGEPDILWKKS